MKIIFRFTIMVLTMIILSGRYSEISKVQAYSAADKALNTQANPPVTHLQTKGQVEFFRQALDEFGAVSPEQVISIWVKAEDTRNGVFHYAVACDELKNKIIKDLGEPRDSFWIIGGSSPWLSRYEIVYNKKLNDLEYEVKIRFFWESSAGSSKPTETTLVIVKNKDRWCVKEANSF